MEGHACTGVGMMPSIFNKMSPQYKEVHLPTVGVFLPEEGLGIFLAHGLLLHQAGVGAQEAQARSLGTGTLMCRLPANAQPRNVGSRILGGIDTLLIRRK